MKFRVDTLTEHIKCNGDNVRVTCSFTVTEYCTLNSVRTCKQCKFAWRNACTSVVMCVNADNKMFTIVKVLAHIFDLVGIYVCCRNFDSWRKIYDNFVCFGRLEYIKYGICNFCRIVRLCTSETFRWIFKSDISVKLTVNKAHNKLCTVNGKLLDFFLTFSENNFTLKCWSWVVKVDNCVFSTL